MINNHLCLVGMVSLIVEQHKRCRSLLLASYNESKKIFRDVKLSKVADVVHREVDCSTARFDDMRACKLRNTTITYRITCLICPDCVALGDI